MKPMDRYLQRQRINQVKPYIKPGVTLLDVGCSDGILFKLLGQSLRGGVGIEPLLESSVDLGKFQLIPGFFPQDAPVNRTFDLITMLAVMEHIPLVQQKLVVEHCIRLLNRGGYLLITVPSKLVDTILSILRFARLIDGMSLEEHYGFDPATLPTLFNTHDFELVRYKRFQLGLNNLFVFRKI